jgi:putative ATP-binding cassette transporter
MARLAAFFRAFWMLARPYWTESEERRSAWLLLVAVVVLNLGTVALNVWFNQWNNGFYNSLQEKDFDSFKELLVQFSGVAVVFIGVAVYQLYLSQMLRLRWRRWLTETWLAEWLRDHRYYLMQMQHLGTDNPDQRIADDLRKFADYSLSLTIGLMNAVVTLVSFLGILWGLSGDYALSAFGVDIDIPGYMVWVALVYAGLGTWLTHAIGRPLVGLNFNQERVEADFRFHLIRLRENVEGVALLHGEAAEKAGLSARFRAIFGNYFAIMRKQKQLTWFTAGYGQLAVVFPFLVAAPRYFGGAIPLGGLMQTASAFGQVQSSLSYLITSYTDLAEWWAVISRLETFAAGLRKADELRAGSHIEQVPGDALAVQDLALDLPTGKPLFTVPPLAVAPGSEMLLRGRSGSGKSTLFRALAGLWPFGRGRITMPDAANTLFLPQRPYLPVDTLRAALAYPMPPETWNDHAYAVALAEVGLEPLASHLGESANWAQRLSGGEQQRVQLVRALLRRPAWLFLDEATAALDEAGERSVLDALRAALPGTAIVSIGHRSALEAFHRQQLDLTPA